MTRFDATFRDYIAPNGWRLSTALECLDVTTEAFDHVNNAGADGYSHARVLAVNPEPKLWNVPIIVAHELAHIVLGHTTFVLSAVELRQQGINVEVPLARFELEAHTVARAVSCGLGLSERERQGSLVRHYIDGFARQCEPLSDADAIRLAWATVNILEAGEGRLQTIAVDAPRRADQVL